MLRVWVNVCMYMYVCVYLYACVYVLRVCCMCVCVCLCGARANAHLTVCDLCSGQLLSRIDNRGEPISKYRPSDTNLAQRPVRARY